MSKVVKELCSYFETKKINTTSREQEALLRGEGEEEGGEGDSKSEGHRGMWGRRRLI